jgi:hypothetical protein
VHPKSRDQTPAGWATLATLSVLTVIAVLVLATGGPAKTGGKRAAENCPADGGGGGGTPSPTDSPSESPSMSGLPIPTLPLPTDGESETPTASPSESGGVGSLNCTSTITIDYDKKADAFEGKVGSKRSDCEGGRKVVLNKDEARPKKDVKVGAATTKPSGKWSVKGLEDPPGKYYAKVKKDTTTEGEDTVVCKPAKSKTINP